MFEERLMKRAAHGNLRSLSLSQGLIDFSSNDYLGLARSSRLMLALRQECERFPCLGSTGSRLLTGNTAYTEDLEKQIARFHGYDAGLLFSCGYMANLGLLSAIGGDSTILFDARVHASTRDGIRLSRAHALPFRHNDLSHLEQRLKNSVPSERFICVESLYSTDGSAAPLQGICDLANRYGAHVIVDEAHAVGIWGPGGRGLVAEQKLTPHVFAQINTFGKALGVYGAIVLGSHSLRQALINFAHAFIYTTALPFHCLAAIKCSYALFPQMEPERKHVHKLAHGHSQIRSITFKGNQAAKEAAKHLAEKGFDVRPLLSPTVQRGQEALRICLHAFNTEAEWRDLCKESSLPA